MGIKFNNVSYICNNQTQLQKTIINNLSFDIKENTIAGFIGPTGSGKSTILELINGLILPTKGEIIVGDTIIGKKTPKNIAELRFNVGMVSQNPESQFFCTTIKKEIEFALQSFNFKVKEKEKRISDSLKMVGLNDTYLDRSPFSLSKGEGRKVAIAIVLAFNPQNIILDEPTMGLDSASRKHLIKLIKMMKLRYDKTIIIVSSDTNMLHSVADYVYLIDDGKVVTEGDKYKIFGNYELLKNYNIKCPKIIEFSHLVKETKGIDIGYRDDINDLMKDVYRYVK